VSDPATMCKRNTTDPLIRLVLDRYHLHLLSVPREQVTVGTLYVHDGRQVGAAGNVAHLLDPPFDAAAGMTTEAMADVAGQMTRGVSLSAGLGFLDGVLGALGAGAILDKVRAGFERNGARSLRFRFTDVTREAVDVLELGKRIWKHRLLEDHALAGERNRYYLVTAVARTHSINIVAERESATKAELDVDALKLAAGTAGVGVTRTENGEVSFHGPKRLAFGVELHELLYDPAKESLRLRMPAGYVAVRGEAPRVAPAVLGGPDDDAFLDVP
jgi:hypothetical protein